MGPGGPGESGQPEKQRAEPGRAAAGGLPGPAPAVGTRGSAWSNNRTVVGMADGTASSAHGNFWGAPLDNAGALGAQGGVGGRVESKPTVVGRSEIPGNPVYFCDYNPVLDARLTWLKHTITLGLLYKIYNKNLILSCLQIFGVRSLTAGSSSTVCLQITERKTKAQSQLGEFRTERGPAVTHSCCKKSILPGSGGDQTQRR